MPLYQVWAIQDALLQSYRRLFLGLQLGCLGLTALLLALNRDGLAWVFCALGLYCWWTWRQVCPARARDVTFTQDLILAAERGDASCQGKVLTAFKHFQSLSDATRATYDSDIHPSQTRRRFEVSLPWAFSLAWVYLVAAHFFPGLR